MEKKLEQLLNSLIKKGWKPRGEKVNKVIKTGIDEFGDGYVLFDGELNGYKQRGCNMTELVSKSSGLWQFVCENDYWVHKDTYFAEKYTDHTAIHLYQCNDYRYWLLGSALCDEDKLEDFILGNIKIDE